MDKNEKEFAVKRASRGGRARADAMTKEERRAQAKAAALARWSADMPQAECEGTIKLGDAEIVAAVLPNGMRLLSQGTFLQAIGRSRTPKAGTGILSTVDELPFFLQAEQLQPFVSEKLALATTPIHFRSKSGQRVVGYDASLLPMVCDVYLKFRDACAAEGREVPSQYRHIVKACDLLVRGLAQVGIVALVDEATGYQDKRAKDALARILEQFVTQELRAYVKTFPIDYYREIYRLRGWPFPPKSHKHNSNLGKFTNDLVYDRLAPGVRQELNRLTPRRESGRLKHKLFQHLSEDTGHPKLREHLAATVTVMKLSDTWDDFKNAMDKVLPKQPKLLAEKASEDSD
jgi:hypothetical protein